VREVVVGKGGGRKEIDCVLMKQGEGMAKQRDKT
jgi:hypothetical protein